MFRVGSLIQSRTRSRKGGKGIANNVGKISKKQNNLGWGINDWRRGLGSCQPKEIYLMDRHKLISRPS